MKPYTCIVNDLALLINLLHKIDYHHQTYIIGANIIVRPLVAMYLLSSFVLTYQIFFKQFFVDKSV